MGRIVLGMVVAAMWFALSHAANAERVCREVCDNGACVSRCIERPDSEVIVRHHDRYYDERGPGVDVHGPGVDIDIGR